MIFHISEIPVYFPYDTISHEQICYITELIRTFISKENLFIEMSAGSGKTICLLAAAVSYQMFHNENNKRDEILLKRFVYCTRTVPETEKTLSELKFLIKYIKENHASDLKFLGLGLTSRKHFCVNSSVKGNIEIECRKLLAGKGCQYFNRVEEVDVAKGLNFSPISLDGVYTIDELKHLGSDRVFCPYFFIRKLTSMCNILICTFNYMLDPGIAEKMTFPTNPLIIFDEAHNIDNACIEAFKHEITRDTLRCCKKGIEEIEKTIRDRAVRVASFKNDTFQKEYIGNEASFKRSAFKNDTIQGEYISNGAYSIRNNQNTTIYTNKNKKDFNAKIPGENKEKKNIDIEEIYSQKHENISDKTQHQPNNGIEGGSLPISSFPGAIRKDIHVISLLKRIVEFTKIKFKSTHLTINSTNSFLSSMTTMIFSNRKTLSLLYTRYKHLPVTFSENTDKLAHLVSFINTLCSFYQSDAFTVIYEPNTLSSNKKTALNIDPKLTLSCNDSRIAISKMIKHECLVITSGTLTPFEAYKDLLAIDGRTISIRGERTPDLLIVTKGNDQLNITSIEEKVLFDTDGVNQPDPSQFTPKSKTQPDTIHLNQYNSNVQFDTKPCTDAPGSKSHSPLLTDSKSEHTPLSSSYKLRNTPSTIRNYMTLISSLSQIIPDGMIIFFPSYLFMNEIIAQSNIRDFKKPIFIETVNYQESITALENYKKSIRVGRGGLFLCVARGKVSEGIDFKDAYGRGCLLIGVPFAYTESVIIQQRVRYLAHTLKLSAFLQFDALRHAMQCLGRVIRGKNDYGLIIIADYRYNRYISTLSTKYSVIDTLSIDMAINYGKLFFRRMANREPIKMIQGDQVQQYIKE